MITLDHKGGRGVWIGPKSDHTKLEQPLTLKNHTEPFLPSFNKLEMSTYATLPIYISSPNLTKNLNNKSSMLTKPHPTFPSSLHLIHNQPLYHATLLGVEPSCFSSSWGHNFTAIDEYFYTVEGHNYML